MMEPKGEIWKSGRRVKRGAVVPALGSILFAAVVAGLPACEKNDGGVSEAVEEMKDEAKDAKDEIKDEIDDHT